MALIDPFSKYRPIGSGRRRKTWIPSFRTVVLFTILFVGAFLSWNFLQNQYNFLRGLKYWNQDKLELAKMEFNKVLERSHNNPMAIDGLGLVEMKAGRLAEAKKYYSQAMKAGLTFKKKFSHLKTGQAFVDQGKYVEAELELQHALELQPNSPQVHASLGTVQRALGQVANGVKSYEKALSLAPKDRDIQQLLEQGREERDRGGIYYIFDRKGQPLAQWWYKNGERGYGSGKEFAHLIGYVDTHVTNNRGSAGLEHLYQSQFPGNKLHLTLDTRVQRLLSKAMGWQKGAIVVLNPRTGEILGAISQPTYLPEKVNAKWWEYVGNPNRPLKNRAFEGLYEPGSIIKIITSAAAIEKNVDLKQIFPFKSGHYIEIDGKFFYDWKKHGWIRSLEEAFDSSSNIAYAKVGFALGADALLEFDNRFGFNSVPKTIPIPVAMSTSPKLGLSRYEMAEASTGLGKDFKITPLNAAMIAAAIANDGLLMSPYMVSKLTNINGKILEESRPQEYKKTISRQTARTLATMMLNDVERGIGVKARTKGVKIAGKTGTSGSRDPNFHAWFICFAPADNPKVAMAILAEHGGTGKDIAAPIAHTIFEGLRDILDDLQSPAAGGKK